MRKSEFTRKAFIAIVVGSVFLSGFLAGCNRPAAATDEQVRPPAVAGAFYPGEPQELQQMVDSLLRQAPAAPAQTGQVKALVVPHAGYIYSAAIAAAGWKALAGMNPDLVYVLGTAHYAPRSGFYAWAGRAFHTPLGDYPVDTAVVRALAAACPQIQFQPEAWTQEHSVEVQVPFLQRVAPGAKLIPLVVADASLEDCRAVGAAIARQASGRKAVIVASTDLSHYPAWADARRVDQAMIQAMLTLDPGRLAQEDRKWMRRGVGQLACTVCGLSAVETVMTAATRLGANRAQLLASANSGDVSGDKARVVGYATLAFFGPAAPSPLAATEGDLTPTQQAELLALARAAIAQALGAGEPARNSAVPAWMQTPSPVFVTLKEHGDLRGCIGMTEAVLPLGQAVKQMACAAAFEDPRFGPVTARELLNLNVEISVLSPLRRIQSPADIKLGVHGVVVRREGRSGLFLPQVATETGWSRDVFLDELCSQKAGLPAGAWRDKETELYVFTVQAFGEKAGK
jgi:MEMO1 family protein